MPYGRFHIFGCLSRDPGTRGELAEPPEAGRGPRRGIPVQAGFGDLDKDPETWFPGLGHHLPRRDFQRGEHVCRGTPHSFLRLLKDKVEETLVQSGRNSEHWKEKTPEACAGSSRFPFLSLGHHRLLLCAPLSPRTVSVWAHSNVCVCVT